MFNGGITASPRDLVFMVESIPQGSTFTVSGIGRYEFQMAAMAIIMGGHVRVGFEDKCIYLKRSNS